MRRGFLYLVAIMDWATRKVLAWRLSNTMDVGFCVMALEEALMRYGTPAIFNTDQGSQGVFNRSSQHWFIVQILDTRSRLQLVSSN
jgi:transposase InsO family protein